MKIIENQVYIWEENNAILGFSRVNINGIKEDFGAGYEMSDVEGKPVKHALAKNRAIRQVKIQLANVFDALKLYGKEILDIYGNIDNKKFMEFEAALQRKKHKDGKIDLSEKDLTTKLKDLKVNIINSEIANKLRINE